MDWAREYAKVKYAYTVELRDSGEKKFLVPESEITATGEETWSAVKVIARQVIKDSKNKPTGEYDDVPNSSQNIKSTTELDNETEESATEEDEDEEEVDEEDDPSKI